MAKDAPGARKFYPLPPTDKPITPAAPQSEFPGVTEVPDPAENPTGH